MDTWSASTGWGGPGVAVFVVPAVSNRPYVVQRNRHDGGAFALGAGTAEEVLP